MSPRRTFLAREVVQTSAMDCGPAALASLLAGLGVPVSYERLREACQTDVDGTSIDTLEEVACALGLEAEQTMLPPDHLLLAEAGALPALVVVRLPSGFTHFVVVWRRVGPFVELMDPAAGRRWLPVRALLRELYVHEMAVPAAAFRQWAASPEFLGPLRRRLADMGCAREVEPAIATALEDEGWRPLARLDAAVRITAAAVRAGGLARGREAGAAVLAQYERTHDEESIQRPYWTCTAAPPGDGGEEQVTLRGAVVLQVHGRRERLPDAPPLSRELAVALADRPVRPFRELAYLAFEGGSGGLVAAALAVTLAAATLGTALEALVLRGAMSLGRELGVVQQRLGGMLAVCALLALLLALEVGATRGTLRVGRRLELRLRMLFLRKLPRLGDRYFATRPVSDMAQRAHAIHLVRTLPELGLQVARTLLEIAVTAAGIAWLDPASLPLAALTATVVLVIPFASLPSLTERDLRLRTHAGSLTRFTLDATLGLSPIRAHAAERAVEREHESLLVEWARAARAVARTYVGADLAQSLAGLGLSAWLLARYVGAGGAPGGVVLLVYWALQLPLLGQDLVALLRQYPQLRSTTLRLLEPVGAREEAPAIARPTTPRDGRGVALVFDRVRVLAGGHTLLDELTLSIPPGSHVAVVGASGAGKSSLLGLLLGWHKATSGSVLVDGAPITEGLRSACAWVDPQVMLWNRSVAENLAYGAPPSFGRAIPGALASSDLQEVLEKLPGGLQTPLGEGGALLSGGEGQRLRFARALLRPDARLVLLDEPFRGLDRERRHALLGRARRWWKKATLLCVTHDVAETEGFDRVLVVHEGRIVEDGSPRELLAREASRYRMLLDEEAAMLREVWTGGAWRRVRLDAGTITEDLPLLSERRASLQRADGGRS